MSFVSQSRMSAGREFQTDAAMFHVNMIYTDALVDTARWITNWTSFTDSLISQGQDVVPFKLLLHHQYSEDNVCQPV